MPVSETKISESVIKAGELVRQTAEAVERVLTARNQFLHAYRRVTAGVKDLDSWLPHKIDGNSILWENLSRRFEISFDFRLRPGVGQIAALFYDYGKDDSQFESEDADKVFDSLMNWVGEQMREHALRELPEPLKS